MPRFLDFLFQSLFRNFDKSKFLIFRKLNCFMMLKSISSFLASILLIAFTISSGIIIYYFVSTLPRTQMQEVNIQSSRVLSCAGAIFDVKARNCNLLDGLVLWIRMDEGSGNITYDYSGNGNNGTLYNGTIVCGGIDDCPQWVNGKIGKAISFDGVNDYINVDNSPSLMVDEITMAVWFYTTRSEAYQNIVEKHQTVDAPPYNDYAIIIDNLNYVRAEFTYDSTWYSKAMFPMDLNKWQFVAVTFKGGTIKGYKNGTLAFQDSVAGSLAKRMWNVKIGSHFGTRNYFGGIIDEVRIYNRALSEEEIQKLYYNLLENKFNITIGLFNSGYADLGNSFIAYVYLNNGTILQRSLILDDNLKRGYYLEKNLTIEGYYPSYGLVDKIMVCSNDCQGVCSEVIINNAC